VNQRTEDVSQLKVDDEPRFDLVMPHKKITCQASTHAIKDEWLAEITAAINSNAEQRRSVALTKVMPSDAIPLYEQVLKLHTFIKSAVCFCTQSICLSHAIQDMREFVHMLWHNLDRSDVQVFMQAIADIRSWLSSLENKRRSDNSIAITTLARVSAAVQAGYDVILQLNRVLNAACPLTLDTVHNRRRALLQWYMDDLYRALEGTDEAVKSPSQST